MHFHSWKHIYKTHSSTPTLDVAWDDRRWATFETGRMLHSRTPPAADSFHEHKSKCRLGIRKGRALGNIQMNPWCFAFAGLKVENSIVKLGYASGNCPTELVRKARQTLRILPFQLTKATCVPSICPIAHGKELLRSKGGNLGWGRRKLQAMCVASRASHITDMHFKKANHANVCVTKPEPQMVAPICKRPCHALKEKADTSTLSILKDHFFSSSFFVPELHDACGSC